MYIKEGLYSNIIKSKKIQCKKGYLKNILYKKINGIKTLGIIYVDNTFQNFHNIKKINIMNNEIIIIHNDNSKSYIEC